jgi:hypothetical protein
METLHADVPQLLDNELRYHKLTGVSNCPSSVRVREGNGGGWGGGGGGGGGERIGWENVLKVENKSADPITTHCLVR